MFVSIVICTWNRAELLDAALREMTALRIPADTSWELLVVNNNCSDSTDTVVSRYASSLPIRRLFEPKQGLSHARNCALDAARGELILWVDDDVLVAADWLTEYVTAAEAHPNAMFFGGTIEPYFPVKPPKWIKRNRLAFLSAYALKEPPSQVLMDRPEADIPIGANMAVRKCALGDFRFDPNLGRRGKELISGEEQQLFRKLLDDGLVGIWVPSARVRHYIPPERLTVRYLWGYYHGYGKSHIRMRTFKDDKAMKTELASLRKEYWASAIANLRWIFSRDLKWASAFQSSAIKKGMLDALRDKIRSS